MQYTVSYVFSWTELILNERLSVADTNTVIGALDEHP